MASVKILLAFVAIIPLVSCLTLEALEEMPEYQQFLLIPNKYPKFANFVNSAIIRYQQKRPASTLDIDRFDALLDAYQSEFIETVILAGPEYFYYADRVTEAIKDPAIALLAWVSLDDTIQLVNFIKQNPETCVKLAEEMKHVFDFVEKVFTEKQTALLQLDMSQIADVFETPEFQKLKSIPEKYPVFFDFVKKILKGYQENRVAAEEDIFRLEVSLMGLQTEFIEFVNSPQFFELAEIVKDHFRKVAVPVLGVVPMSDFVLLKNTIDENELLQISLAQDLQTISELVFRFLTKERLELLKLEASKFGGAVATGARRVNRTIGNFLI